MSDQSTVGPVKVSVIVCTYNHERYIHKLLTDLVAQQCSFEFEIIAADDASSDRSAEIIQEMAELHSEIHPVIRTENIGGRMNMLAGFQLSRGEYLCRVDGDDAVFPGKLQAFADFLDANEDVGKVGSELHLLNADGEITGRLFENMPEISTAAHWLTRGMTMAGAMFRRTCIPVTGLWSEPVKGVDTIWQAQLCQSGMKLGWVGEPLGGYRVHSENYTSRRKGDEINQMVKSFLVAANILRGNGQMDELQYQNMVRTLIRQYLPEHLSKESRLEYFLDLMRIGLEANALDVGASFKKGSASFEFKF